MRPRRLAGVGILAFGLAASQVGHLLAATLRRGPVDGAISGGAGVHWYVPTLTSAVLGCAGAVLVATLLLVGAIRLAAAGRTGSAMVARRVQGPPLLDLTSVVFALQLCLFIVQEAVEQAAVGHPVPSIAELLLWGSIGQLPIALLAAIGLRWLAASFEEAVVVIAAAAPQPLTFDPALVPARSRIGWTRPGLLPGPALSTLGERGPPRRLRPGWPGPRDGSRGQA